jgi:hypothetical protein
MPLKPLIMMKSYLIKKGNHYCNVSIFERIFSIGYNVKRIFFRFKLHPECWWSPARNSDDNDLNKLYGLTYGLNSDHSNSVRLAWKPDFGVNGKIDIYGYIYDEQLNSQHISQYIASVQTGADCMAMITNNGNKYEFMVNSINAEMPNNHPDPGLCFRLFPYFGGNNTAPNNMTIEIELQS